MLRTLIDRMLRGGRPVIVAGVVALVAVATAVYLVGRGHPGKPEFEIKTEVLGTVAAGRIYTTAINQRQLDRRLPRSRPFLLELSAEGEVMVAEPMESSPFSYKLDNRGVKSHTVLDVGDPRWAGTTILMDQDRAHRIRVNDNHHTDFHGFLRSGDQSFYFPSYKLHTLPGGVKVESFFIEEQHLDGSVGFTWDSLDHVPLSEADFTELRTYWRKNRIIDYFHGNSIAFANDGHLLVSGRHVNQVLKIDRSSGNVIWRLGGKSSDFEFLDDPRNGFSHQHAVTQLANGNLLLYDNGNLHDPPTTRIVEYEVDTDRMTARLIWSYTDDRFTYATGSVQRLPNGHTLIGWGLEGDMSSSQPRITELDADGKVVMQIYFPDGSGFYAAYKGPVDH